MDVTRQLKKVAVLIDKISLVAALQEMAMALVPAIKTDSIDSKEFFHELREVGVFGLN